MSGNLMDGQDALVRDESASRAATEALGWRTLTSGRALDLHRSRWDGVLDREEYEYCRQNGIPLGYDCTQIGWVVLACTDESSAEPSRGLFSDAVYDATPDPERQAIALRGVVKARAEQILADVRTGGTSAEVAQLRLEAAASEAMKGFASEHSLSISDLCHWALESIVAGARSELRGPLHPAPASGTTGVRFRPWTIDDAPVYMELLGNPKVWEYLPEPFPSPFTPDTARTLIEVASISFHHETSAVEVDGRPVGQCLLRFDQRFADARASEVAYWLGEEHWGKGLMSRVLPDFTYQCFQRHDVDVIYAWIMKDNEASIRVAERAGYGRAMSPLESRLAESLRRPGFIRFATYRSDWPVDA